MLSSIWYIYFQSSFCVFVYNERVKFHKWKRVKIKNKTKNQIEKMNWDKSWLFRKTDKIDKPLARPIEKIMDMDKVFRNEKGAVIWKSVDFFKES